MRPIIDAGPRRKGAVVAEMVKRAMREGMKPEAAEHMMAKIRMSDHTMELYDAVKNLGNPYLTPDSVPPGIIIHEGAKPKFFEQTGDRELREKCDVPTYRLEPQPKNAMIPPNKFDSCQGLQIDFRNMFHAVGMELKGSLADRRGLQMLRDRHDEIPMMLEYKDSNDRDHRYEWYSDGIYEYKNAPHLIVDSLHVSIRDGTKKYILRSELMILLRLMVLKGRRTETRRHAIVPVLLISIRPDQFVIIEAYYDGKHAHVNYGEPIVITEDIAPEEQDKRMRSVLRWATAKPCGETRSYSGAQR
ncbi:hypothetical protein FQN49_002499 [Arthroderma sp. PD_2]|nr:hypothetical protein FQN49_002499 [Arthroderma sp. PD_2]